MDPRDLVEISEIKSVKYRYMRALDQKLWDGLAECLTEDASAAYSGGKYAYEGREAILSFLREAMGAETFLSSHRVTHPEITLTGPTTAEGTWALNDVVIITDMDLVIQGAAFYNDEYVKVDGHWKIHSTGYRRTYEETFSRADIASLNLTASWWGTDGQSDLDA